MQIHRRKGQFAEPGGNVAIHVNVPAAFTGAHGNTKHSILPQGHGSCQGGHLAIVDHLQRSIPFLTDFQEHVAHFGIKILRAYTTEKRSPRNLVM